MTTKGPGHMQFFFAYAQARLNGQSKGDAIAGAHALLGVTTSVSGDLLARAHELVRLLKLWRTAPPRRRAQLRKELKARVPELYPDVCVEHQDIVHRAIARQCRLSKDTQKWKNELGSFYESVQKWLVKTGCSVCPIQKRL